MKPLRLSVVLAVLMGVASVAATVARPSTTRSTGAPRFVLAEMIPSQFGDWKELDESGAQVVNPQTQAMLEKIYSQTLTRTYVNSAGYRIMLSLAYGDDQRGDLQAHKPEVCYPAQGFSLRSNEVSQITTPFGSIPGRRLDTHLGARNEPVTYWFTMGNNAVDGRFQRRLVELKLGLTGQVPDGLLFRVSSIDGTPARAYAAQDSFVSSLLGALPQKDRTRLSGLSAPAASGT